MGPVSRPEEDPVRFKQASAVLCLVTLTAAGCSTDPEPSPPPEPVDSVGRTTSEPPPDDDTETATATAAPTTDASGRPELPPEATEQTEVGAEAFVNAYFEKFNALAENPVPGELNELSAVDCEGCRSFEQIINGLSENSERFGGRFIAVQIDKVNLAAQDAGVEISYRQLGAPLVASDGAPAGEGPDGQGELLCVVSWQDNRWTMTEITLVGP